MTDGWWDDLFRTSGWARARRYTIRGETDAILAGIDLAAAALADPVLADALEAEHVDLDALEIALVHGVPHECDLELLRRGITRVASLRRGTEVSIDDTFTYLLHLPEVADAARLAGIEARDGGWGVFGLGAIGRGLSAAVRPFVGGLERERIVVDDHDVVTRAFVFHLLVDELMLTAIASLRAIRRIEANGRAAVFVGSRAQVDARWQRVEERLRAEGSPLRVTRERAG